jgi:hypothetical protein
MSSLAPHPNRIAVFGSLASRPQPEPGEDDRQRRAPTAPAAPTIRAARFSPSATAVLERSLDLVAANATRIARPILDHAVATGAINGDERTDLLEEFAGTTAPLPDPRPALLRLRQEILAAIRRAAPDLAHPLLVKAIASERLTPAQEHRIITHLTHTDAVSARRGRTAEGGRPESHPESHSVRRGRIAEGDRPQSLFLVS